MPSGRTWANTLDLMSGASRILACSVAMLAAVHVSASGPASPSDLCVPSEMVIYDNDWNVSNGGYDAEDSISILLASPRVRLLGLTSVTGDNWRDEGVVSLLRFLELIKMPDIAVTNGAVFPLVNTLARHRAWEAAFGAMSWSGAWNTPGTQPSAHPQQPFKITPPREGLPKRKASRESSVAFLIRSVRTHPHRVMILADGPLTNLALALKEDPEIVHLAKAVVFVSGVVRGDHDDATRPAGFNVMFDPEAASAVLSAPWHDIIILGDVTNRERMSAALLRRIKAIDTPAARYAAANGAVGLPLWAEISAAIVADPGLAMHIVPAIISVDLGRSKTYGRTRTWPIGKAPPQYSARGRVRIVTAFDRVRFVESYLAALSGKMPRRACMRSCASREGANAGSNRLGCRTAAQQPCCS